MYTNEYYVAPLDYELYHHGVKGMKWGVRRYQNADGSLTNAGKKRYLDDDGFLTSAGKKQMKKLNEMDQKDNRDRFNRNAAQRNVDKFSKGKDPVSKLLTNLNKKHISNFDKTIEQNDAQIKSLINDMKSQKVDVVLRYNPYSERMYYKQSDSQQTQAKDSKLYRKEGIKVTRDDQGRIASVKSENANAKTVKKVNNIARRGYY